eukprot:5118235-Prymnesium_polylepis.1
MRRRASSGSSSCQRSGTQRSTRRSIAGDSTRGSLEPRGRRRRTRGGSVRVLTKGRRTEQWADGRCAWMHDETVTKPLLCSRVVEYSTKQLHSDAS